MWAYIILVALHENDTNRKFTLTTFLGAKNQTKQYPDFLTQKDPQHIFTSSGAADSFIGHTFVSERCITQGIQYSIQKKGD